MIQIILYGCVGAIAAVVDFVVFFNTLPLFNDNYILASLLSFSMAVTTNFALCNLFIFTRQNISVFHAYIRHVSTNIMSFLFGLGLLTCFAQSGYFTSLFIPKVLIAGILMLFNYSCARWFSFNNSWHKKEIS